MSPTRLLSLAITLASTASFAGRMTSNAIIAGRAEAVASPNAGPTLRFGCESRKFDLSQGLFCYNPLSIRAAYGIDKLIANGADGTGQTIVILDAFGSPTIDADLAAFDAAFGLPPPPSFQQIRMPGTPVFDPADPNVVGWTVEIALDVEWAHAVAPNASIVLVAAKSNSDQDLMDGFNFAVANRLGSAISMSFGEAEIFLANPDGFAIVEGWQAAFKKAADAKITSFASSGDQGVDTQDINDGNGNFTASASWPAASDLVTSVGGTNLFFGIGPAANPAGAYESERVWNDLGGAGGGGVSILTSIPNFQRDNLPDSVVASLHGRRAIPDVAYNAGVAGGVLVHIGTLAPGATSFFLVGGTSAGSPQWAGVMGDLNSVRGNAQGFFNDDLYKLGRQGRLNMRDVTVGDNGFDGVPGFPASAGFDLSTGWGTPDFAVLATSLNSHQNN
jgi:subtilase family serine protease